MNPFSAIIVVLKVSSIFDDKFLRLLPLSYKKMFSSSLSIFFSTITVDPLNVSLNCCDFTVGKK